MSTGLQLSQQELLESECEYSFDNIIENIGFGRIQMQLLILCSVGYMGMCAEFLLVVFLNESLTNYFNISDEIYCFYPFLNTLVSLLSGLIFGIISDKIGRQLPFIFSLFFVIIGSILSVLFSYNFIIFLIFRSIVNIGIGCLTSIDYILYIEYTNKSIRGKTTLYITIFGTFGVLYICLICYILLDSNIIKNDFINNHAWETVILLSLIPIIVCFIFRIIFRYESIPYMISKKQYNKAYLMLKYIASNNKNNNYKENKMTTFPTKIDFINYYRYKSNADIILRHQYNLNGLCISKHDIIQTILVSIVWIFHGISYWGFTLFLPAFFNDLNINNSYLIMSLMIVVEIPGIYISSKLIDKIGRILLIKILYMCGIISCVALILLVSIFETNSNIIQILISICCCLIYFFVIPIWGILTVYSSELYPSHLRSTAIGYFYFIQSIFLLPTPWLSNYLVNDTKYSESIYIASWTICLIIALVCISMVKHETKKINLT